MCGILAVFYSASSTCLDKIWKAHEVLRKRGPDSSSILMSKREFLCFKRLAIVDTSTAGNQPFLSDDKQVAVMCNGEIYNYKQLIEDYNLSCRSQSDCEVLLRLYEKIGFQDMVSLLDGVFAIVLRDYRTNVVYAARDYIGVRPLFTGITVDGSLAFGSVAAALLPFCTDVKQFPASHFVKLEEQDRTPFEINLNPQYIHPPLNYLESVSSLRHLLFTAVSKRLQGDRPVGCLLSGGLDSSIVAFILTRLLGAGNVRTYSVGLRDPEQAGENHRSLDCRYAEQVAQHLGTVHTEVSFTPQDGCAMIPEVIQALETYDITTVRASVPMYILAQYIKKETKDTIIFSGEGSDELFAGYLYFKKAPSLSALLLESQNLIKELPYFDVLRADRCVSSNGLEVRVPFLDVHVVEFAKRMGESKAPVEGVEKYHLRTCFDSDLPEQVLLRRKDGLSDGCSGVKTWSTYIQEFVEPLVSDEDLVQSGLPSKEALYYKRIYDGFYPSLTTNCPHYWLPKWSGDVKDPSGRLVEKNEEW